MESLPDNLRIPVVLHYFQGLDQTHIASQLGVSQSTVSRHLDKAVTLLREDLRKAGIIVPVALLTVLMAGKASVAAPMTLTAALGKMAISGVGASATASVQTSIHLAAERTFGTLGGKLTAGALAVILAGTLAYRSTARETAPTPIPTAVPAAGQVQAVTPVPAFAGKPVTVTEVTPTPMESPRSDPFQPAGFVAAASAPAVAAPIPDLPTTRLAQTVNVRVDDFRGPEPPQPVRRMTGIVRGQALSAIIESNGKTQVVQPGDMLNDGLAVVESIEQDRIILRSTGRNPQPITVALAPSPTPPQASQPTPPPGMASPPAAVAPPVAAPRPVGRMMPGVGMMRPGIAAVRRAN